MTKTGYEGYGPQMSDKVRRRMSLACTTYQAVATQLDMIGPEKGIRATIKQIIPELEKDPSNYSAVVIMRRLLQQGRCNDA